MSNEKIEKKTDITIPIVSDEDSETLIDDIRELNTVIQNEACKEGVENALRTIISGQFPITSTEPLVESVVGESPARVITFALNSNDVSIVDNLGKAKVPKEAIAFIKHLTLKYGFYFVDYKSTLDHPNDITRIHWDSNFDFEENDLIMKAELQKRNNDIVTIEGPMGTYVWLVTRILENIVQTSVNSKEKMPEIEVPISISDLKSIKEHIDRIEALLKEQSSKPKALSQSK